MRARENFDNGWMFYKGDIFIRYSIKAGMVGGLTDCGDIRDGHWLEIAFSDKKIDLTMDPAGWMAVDLPHDWCVEGHFIKDEEAPASLPKGIGCYRKIFKLPEEDKGKKIQIEFDGIMRNSTVWVNGHLMGTHLSGYTSFHYDISDVLRYGDEGQNVIFVKVDARESEGWWYDGCGIYRHVWITKTEQLHVSHWGTYVTTPTVSDSKAKIRVRTNITNEYCEEKRFQLISNIIDKHGTTIKVASTEDIIYGDSNKEYEHTIWIDNPMLWSPDEPNLYKVLTEIKIGKEIIDTYVTTFGIRTIEFTPDKGFFLNGKHLVIKGTSNHSDFAGVGVALPDSINEYRIQLLKEMGSNAYRCSVHAPTPELLDICDRLGMLVMDENRKLDSSSTGIENLKSLLYRDRNHPSIILWGMENEEDLEGTAMGTRILTTLARITRKLDPTRPVTAAMNHGRNEEGYGDAVDIVGYNYGNFKVKDENGNLQVQDITDHAKYPLRKMIGSETTSCTTTRGIYEYDMERGYVPEYGTVVPGWCCHHEKPWQDLISNPFLTGMFVWTGFDYRGEPSPTGWPCINSHFGIMDTCGIPKDSYFFYKAAWTDEPMVHIFPHWNWPEKLGQNIEVWAFSNCQTVELFLNGSSLGEKKVDRNSHTVWNAKYVPGELIAKGKIDGKIVAIKKNETVNPPAKILLEPHRSILNADGCDVSVVKVAILDDKDRVMPIADNEVYFSIEGPGKILGVGNGNPSSHEPDKANRRRAFNGYCIVLIQAKNETGKIMLKGSSNGLLSHCVSIEVK